MESNGKKRTFIKVGQRLSIRTDLLSPAYIRGLQTLQDQVPPFETEIAREILEEAWGVTSIDLVVDGISVDTSPVAAASLGQVYKARLKETGQDIAIKVQRPNIEEQKITIMAIFLAIFSPQIENSTSDLNMCQSDNHM